MPGNCREKQPGNQQHTSRSDDRAGGIRPPGMIEATASRPCKRSRQTARRTRFSGDFSKGTSTEAELSVRPKPSGVGGQDASDHKHGQETQGQNRQEDSHFSAQPRRSATHITVRARIGIHTRLRGGFRPLQPVKGGGRPGKMCGGKLNHPGESSKVNCDRRRCESQVPYGDCRNREFIPRIGNHGPVRAPKFLELSSP